MKPAGLTFHWPDPRPISFLLPGFVALSFFLHALVFYLFQVVYPPSVSITPPPTQVSLLMRSNPDHQALLHWIEAEDPAGVSKPPEVTPPNLFDLSYKPSYAEVHAAPKRIEESHEPVHFPAPSSALISKNLQPKNAAPTSPALTQVRFSDALATRIPNNLPPIQITEKTVKHLAPTRFLIGVTDRGEVRFTFLQTASGDEKIDQQAEMHLAGIKFPPASDAMTWGFAIYAWGNDAYSPISQAAAK